MGPGAIGPVQFQLPRQSLGLFGRASEEEFISAVCKRAETMVVRVALPINATVSRFMEISPETITSAIIPRKPISQIQPTQ